MNIKYMLGGAACCLLLLTACNFTPDNATPTFDGIIEEPINPLPEQQDFTSTPSPSPTASPASIVELATATATFTSAPPSITPTPSETPGPWEHVIRPGEILTVIIQQPPYNYRDFSVIDEIVRLNNLPNAESIVAGQTILIPRPTPTLIPLGVNLTETADAALGLGQRLGSVALPTNTEFGCHTVREGESIVEIIDQYGGATLEIIAQINPDINFFGCDFDEPSGGPGCSPLIVVDQCVRVPLPTRTPTLSPTPSGSETATPTPTYFAPRSIYPPDGGIAPAGIVTLQWVSVGELRANEVYLVEVTDTTTGSTWRQVTRSTSIRLPETLIPSDGQTHMITWSVRVAVASSQGIYAPISPAGRLRTFQWQSR